MNCGYVVALAAWLAATPLSADEVKARCVDPSDRGQDLRDQGKLVEARAQFLACSEDACPPVVRRACQQWLSDVEQRLPTLVLRVRDAGGADVTDAAIRVDDERAARPVDGRAFPIDPGVHSVHVESPGHLPLEQKVLIREGERLRTLELTLSPRPAEVRPPVEETAPGPVAASARSARPFPWLAVSLAAVGVLGGILFSYWGLTARSQVDALRAGCAPYCSDADVQLPLRNEIAANVSLGVGIVAVAAAAWVFLAGYFSAEPKPDGSARVSAAP